GDIRNRQSVLSAIKEFDELGRERFLRKYGFGKARLYFLIHEGRRYDSKAIAGAARGYANPALGPLTSEEFSGGELTVKKTMEDLGFEVLNLIGSEKQSGEVRNACWALAANPSIYRVLEAVQELETDEWTTRGRPIHTGDQLIFWQTRDSQGRRGVVALGDVLSEPRQVPDAFNKFWGDAAAYDQSDERVRVRYRAVRPPIWLGGTHDDFLMNLAVARARGGSVFRVTLDQWNMLEQIAVKRLADRGDEDVRST
ncbi:unnamed protein product, partial [marine sediment metagenome]